VNECKPLPTGRGRTGRRGAAILAGGRALQLKFSVSMTSHAYLLETEGLFTHGSRPGRTFCESVGVIDNTNWSNVIRHHIFYTRPDTEFNNSSTAT
jgi:hypothetical protein